jgi:hypothetical protein
MYGKTMIGKTMIGNAVAEGGVWPMLAAWKTASLSRSTPM